MTAERLELARACERLERPLRIVKGALGVIQVLKAHPVLVMGLTALLVSGRWMKADKLPWPLWTLWRILRPLTTSRPKQSS